MSSFLGHPRGLATLFFTEMWERFSYYGMRAILILFMTASASSGGLGLDTASAGVIYGLYTASAYLAALPGGWIADRVIGQRRAVLYGAVLIAAGNFSLFLPSYTAFYCGLCLVVLGTGLLKPNVSTIVGQLYSADDRRRDAGFSIFYTGINLGAFSAPLVCGWAATHINWRLGFLIAGVGMVIGLVQYVLGEKTLGAAGVREDSSVDNRTKGIIAAGSLSTFAVICLIAVLMSTGVLSLETLADASGALLLVIVLVFFGWMFTTRSWEPIERKRLIVVAGLFVASVIFWSVFEQAGSSMNLFAQRATDNRVAGFDVPAPWYQSINALFIISLSPVFAVIWTRLGDREPSSPAKFAWGLAFAGSGFLVLGLGATIAESGTRVSPLWLLGTYLLHTIGELCLSPVGLSAMSKLAPQRVAGLMMGVWFLSLSIGNYLGGRVAAFYEAMPLHLLFGVVGVTAIAGAILLSLLVRPMVRLMSGVK